MKTKRSYKYDIAISFAEEDRDIAIAVRTAFKLEKLKELHFYYYPDQPHEVAGYKSLNQRLHVIYNEEAQYAIIVLTKTYSKSDGYRQIELEAIKKRLAIEEGRYLFVLAKAGTSPKDIGLPDDFPVIWWDHNPEFLANIFLKVQNGQEIPEEIPKGKVEAIPIGRRILLGFLMVLALVLLGARFYVDISKWLTQDTISSSEAGEVETDSVDMLHSPIPVDGVKEMTPGEETEEKPDENSHYPGLFTDKTIKGSKKKDIAILTLDGEDGTPQSLLASNISELLQSDNRKIYTGLLDARAINEEGLNELLASNTQSIARYHPERVLDYIIVGILRKELQKNIHDAYTLNLYLQLSVIDLRDKSRSIAQSFTGSGLHFQKEAVEFQTLAALTDSIAKNFNYEF